VDTVVRRARGYSITLPAVPANSGPAALAEAVRAQIPAVVARLVQLSQSPVDSVALDACRELLSRFAGQPVKLTATSMHEAQGEGSAAHDPMAGMDEAKMLEGIRRMLLPADQRKREEERRRAAQAADVVEHGAP